MLLPPISNIRNLFRLIFGSNVAIEVEPQKLFDASTKLTTKAKSVQYQLTDISERMASMSTYWEGNVHDFRKTSVKKDLEYMEKVVGLMEEYSLKLKTISEKYVESENKNKDSANALQTNIIS